MKKLAFVSFFVSAFLNAGSVFGQTSSQVATVADQYEFVFGNVGISSSKLQSINAFPNTASVPANVTANVTIEKFSSVSGVFQAVPLPEWNNSATVAFQFGAGNTLTFSAPDINGVYQLFIRWDQADGPHQLTKVWMPSGMQDFVYGPQANEVWNLMLGPAETVGISTSLPSQSVILLGGVAPRTDVDYVVYQRGGAAGQVVHAVKGAYALRFNETTCQQMVTLTVSTAGFSEVPGPIFVGVKANGMQVDQLLVMPMAPAFDPQCQ